MRSKPGVEATLRSIHSSSRIVDTAALPVCQPLGTHFFYAPDESSGKLRRHDGPDKPECAQKQNPRPLSRGLSLDQSQLLLSRIPAAFSSVPLSSALTGR